MGGWGLGGRSGVLGAWRQEWGAWRQEWGAWRQEWGAVRERGAEAAWLLERALDLNIQLHSMHRADV